MKELNRHISAAAAATERALQQFLPLPHGPEQPLYEAMRYSVFAGGKRLRPALFLAAADVYDLDWEAVLPWAAAVEMIHTYSLIHDDLPGMDNDDLRRGQPTCHKVYGEAMAILAGDALLSEGLALLMTPLSGIDPLRQLEAAALIAREAGATGMVAGQAAEFALAETAINAEALDYIYRRKTGALFSAAVLSAAMLGGAEQQERLALSRYCSQLGRAFQIADDILDIRGDARQLGKAPGSDQRNAKTTYAALLGCEAAQQLAQQAAEQAIAQLDCFGQRAALLRKFPLFFISRSR